MGSAPYACVGARTIEIDTPTPAEVLEPEETSPAVV
jgi:hypothetical protein